MFPLQEYRHLVPLSFFDGTQPFRNDKPIRLIELFAGYGSQALALKYLGVPFEHYRISEWATKSIQAYKDIHAATDKTDYSKGLTVDEIKVWLANKISLDYNTPASEAQINRMGKKTARQLYNAMQATRNVGSITQATASDLAIEHTDKFLYILTYSFPCQDLSSAGGGAGMSKGSGTRSGLLWEVERLLHECAELPQVLLMENVPQVVGSRAIRDFAQWLEILEKLGYKNYHRLMNAKDYGIPQNRNRCFMVSILGDHFYTFPQPRELQYRLKDYLDRHVDEKYYLSDETIEMFIEHTQANAARVFPPYGCKERRLRTRREASIAVEPIPPRGRQHSYGLPYGYIRRAFANRLQHKNQRTDGGITRC